MISKQRKKSMTLRDLTVSSLVFFLLRNGVVDVSN